MSRFEPSERSDQLSSAYASNQGSNPFTQLRASCKKFTEKSILSLTKLSPTLPTIKVVSAILKILSILEPKFKLPEDWNQTVRILLKNSSQILELITQIPYNIEVLEMHRSAIMKSKTI